MSGEGRGPRRGVASQNESTLPTLLPSSHSAWILLIAASIVYVIYNGGCREVLP